MQVAFHGSREALEDFALGEVADLLKLGVGLCVSACLWLDQVRADLFVQFEENQVHDTYPLDDLSEADADPVSERCVQGCLCGMLNNCRMVCMPEALESMVTAACGWRSVSVEVYQD